MNNYKKQKEFIKISFKGNPILAFLFLIVAIPVFLFIVVPIVGTIFYAFLVAIGMLAFFHLIVYGIKLIYWYFKLKLTEKELRKFFNKLRE